jgi:hypothetical protein
VDELYNIEMKGIHNILRLISERITEIEIRVQKIEERIERGVE